MKLSRPRPSMSLQNAFSLVKLPIGIRRFPGGALSEGDSMSVDESSLADGSVRARDIVWLSGLT